MAGISGTFPKEVIITENPARIIRDHSCLMVERQYQYFDRKIFYQCLVAEAVKYFKGERSS